MIPALILTAWLAASGLVCWIAGRFIRVGMTELQPGDQVREVEP